MWKLAVAGTGLVLLVGGYFIFSHDAAPANDTPPKSEPVVVRGEDVDVEHLNANDRARLRELQAELGNIRESIRKRRQDCFRAEEAARQAATDAHVVQDRVDQVRAQASSLAAQARANAANYSVDRGYLIHIGVKPNPSGIPYQVMQRDQAIAQARDTAAQVDRSLPELHADAKEKRAAHAAISAQLDALMRREREIERDILNLGIAYRD